MFVFCLMTTSTQAMELMTTLAEAFDDSARAHFGVLPANDSEEVAQATVPESFTKSSTVSDKGVRIGELLKEALFGEKGQWSLETQRRVAWDLLEFAKKCEVLQEVFKKLNEMSDLSKTDDELRNFNLIKSWCQELLQSP